MESLVSGTTRKRISRKNLEEIQICCPGKKDQDRIVRDLVRLTKNMGKVLTNIALQKQIRKQLIDQIFG
jgi:restriction endonuclease S subunit